MNLRDWSSERILFGVLIIGGYLVVNILSACIVGLTPVQQTILHDVTLTMGPLLGVIVQAIWKVDRVDKDNAATLASAVSALSVSTPPAPTAPPTSADQNEVVSSQQNGT